MKQQLMEQIDKAILETRPALLRDTIKMVNIKSVQSESLHGAPFGEGPARCWTPLWKWAGKRASSPKITAWAW